MPNYPSDENGEDNPKHQQGRQFLESGSLLRIWNKFGNRREEVSENDPNNG
jgi:hypothetical protein